MISLGYLNSSGPESQLASRAKVLQLVRLLSGDEMTAVRVSTAVSTCLRLSTGSAEAAEVLLGERQGRVVLSFRWYSILEHSAAGILGGFFDLESDRDDVLLASLRLDLPSDDLGRQLPQLRAIMDRKERDELLADLQERNEELRESLENLRRTRSDKERMESELNIGREIQMSMLPLDFPVYPDRDEFEAYALLEPAREVGGDFYDLFLIDDQHFCFCVGDVSGKGVPSALFMAVTKTLIKSRAANDLSPASILSHVNSELSQNNESCMFVTVFLAILDLEAGVMAYSNAGHNPPYIRSADGALERLANRHGPIVGAVEGIAYSQDVVSLAPEDLVILYTDGVTEAADDGYQLYSEERLVPVISRMDPSDVPGSVQAVSVSVKEFTGEAEQSDDITILGVRFAGRSLELQDHVLDMKVTNDLREIGRVNSAFDELCSRFGVAAAVRRKINLVFDELLNNIVSYAYDDDDEHEIAVSVTVMPDALVIHVTDDGRPFNPFERPTPNTTLGVEEREIGDLGVHLVTNLMDEARYERRGERNVVTLVKRLEDAPKTAAD